MSLLTDADATELSCWTFPCQWLCCVHLRHLLYWYTDELVYSVFAQLYVDYVMSEPGWKQRKLENARWIPKYQQHGKRSNVVSSSWFCMRICRSVWNSRNMYRCRRASGTQEQEYPPPLPLGTADPATVRRGSNPRIIGDHPGAGVPTR